MPDGINNLRRGLEVKMHAVLNDAARDLTDRINRAEPKLNMKAQQTGSGPEAAKVTVSGSAELPKEQRKEILQRIEDAIESTFGR